MKKLLWIFRYIIYSFFLKKSGFPSYIGKPIFINKLNHISIGKKVRIYPNARIETLGNSFIVFEDNISIAQNFHLISGGQQTLTIARGTIISANVFITNVEHEYENTSLSVQEQPLLEKFTYIGKNCFIGYGAVINAGSVLGEHCVIGANSFIKGVYPSYCVIVGTPARVVRRYNTATMLWEKTNTKGEFIHEVQ